MNRPFRWIGLLFITLALLASFVPPLRGQAAGAEKPLALVLTSRGAITPVMVEYLQRGIELARQENAAVLILQLDTPGGSIEIMNQIVKVIRASKVPVVVYVTPKSAMAASAGTVITLAGHVAAMAPDTTIGAASPVGSQGEDLETTMASKEKEILKASVRTLAKERSPEAIRLAENTIENAQAATVDEALEIGLVDIKATDVADLLEQLDGRKVIIDGQTLTLHTAGATQEPLKNTIIEELLLLLVNPNLIFILMAIGVQAILIELSSPGGWVAGFTGAVCLVVAFYGMGLLPVNWFGLIFLVLSFVLFILDIKAPTHGALTATGAVSFIAGALVLFNTARLPGFPSVSVPLVIGVGIFIAASFFAIVTLALRAQKRPPSMGKATLIGQEGIAESDLAPRGLVHVAGEQWQAELEPGEATLAAGEKVVVTRVEGLRVRVRRP